MNTIRSMLSDCETETGTPRETNVVRSLDSQCVQNRDGIGNSSTQGVGSRVARLVAAALTAMVGEDEAEVLAQGLG